MIIVSVDSNESLICLYCILLVVNFLLPIIITCSVLARDLLDDDSRTTDIRMKTF